MRKFLKSAGIRESALLIAGNGLSTGVSAMALIIYSRLLGPVEFGVFSVAFSVTQLLVRLSDAGVHIAVQRAVAGSFESDEYKAMVSVKSGTIIKVMIALGLIATAWIIAPWVTNFWLGSENLEIVKLSIGVSAVTMAFEYVAVLLQSVRKFTASVMMALSQSILKLLMAGMMWLLTMKDAFIAYGLYALAPVVGIIVGVVSLPKFMKKWTGVKVDFVRVLAVIKFTSVAIVSAAIGDNIDILLVQGFLSTYETGLFAAGARLSLLISVLAYSLGTVLSPRVARYQTKYHFSRYLRKSFYIIGAALLGIVVVVPLSHWLVVLTAGPEYIEAVSTVRYLLAAGMLVVATTPIVAMFYTLDNPEYFAYSGILQTVVLVVADVWLIPIMGIEGAGIAKLLARLSVFIFSAIFASVAINKRFKIRIGQELKVANKLGDVF